MIAAAHHWSSSSSSHSTVAAQSRWTSPRIHTQSPLPPHSAHGTALGACRTPHADPKPSIQKTMQWIYQAHAEFTHSNGQEIGKGFIDVLHRQSVLERIYVGQRFENIFCRICHGLMCFLVDDPDTLMENGENHGLVGEKSVTASANEFGEENQTPGQLSVAFVIGQYSCFYMTHDLFDAFTCLR